MVYMCLVVCVFAGVKVLPMTFCSSSVWVLSVLRACTHAHGILIRVYVRACVECVHAGGESVAFLFVFLFA